MQTTPLITTAVALLFVSACGSGSTPSTTSGAGGGIHVGSTSLGNVLVDGNGMTLYVLTADSPGKSTCDSTCLAYWPPAAPASSTALPGVTAAVSRTKTPGGDPIVTVGGWPLYTYVADKAEGDVSGEGVKSFGGTWYALAPDGTPVTSAGSSGGGAGY